MVVQWHCLIEWGNMTSKGRDESGFHSRSYNYYQTWPVLGEKRSNGGRQRKEEEKRGKTKKRRGVKGNAWRSSGALTHQAKLKLSDFLLLLKYKIQQQAHFIERHKYKRRNLNTVSANKIMFLLFTQDKRP